MRVLLTTESYLPYLSGVTISVDALARGLGAVGHDVLVLAPRPVAGVPLPDVGSPGPAPAYAWLPSYQPPLVAPHGYRMPWPVPGTGGIRHAVAFRPEVVHAHSPFVTGVLARRLARRVGAPLVFTHHTRFGDYAHYLGPAAVGGRALTAAYVERYWSRCDAIIAPSTELAAEIRKGLPAGRADRVVVVPTGVDVERIRGLDPIDPRTAAGWPPHATVVATLGRLAPEKRPDLLLEVAAAVPQVRLLVIGGGPSEAALRRRARAPDLAGRVLITGHLPRIDALRRLAGSDQFLFVSRTETQGLVLAEALAAGLPAIVVDGPAVRDSVRDGVDGIVVDAEPVATLVARVADEVRRMAAPSVRLPMAQRAAADADRFSVARRISEVEEVYDEVVRSR